MQIYLDESVMHRGIRLLCDGLGKAGTIRFLGQLVTPSGDYTRDRYALLGDLSIEELFAEARRLQALREAGTNPEVEETDGLARQAMSLLSREMSVVDTLRFLRQFRFGAGNYTEDREDIPLEVIVAEARRLQKIDEHTR